MSLRAEEHPPSRIIPTPQQVEVLSGNFKINSSARIILGAGTNEEDRWSVEQFIEELRQLRKIDLRVVREESLRRLGENYIFIGPPQGTLALELLKARGGVLSAEMKNEGYFLSIEASGVVIIGEMAQGRFYGIMTLVQLIERDKRSILLRRVKIHDWPRLVMRGVGDAVGEGHGQTLESRKRLIRFLASQKLNTYFFSLNHDLTKRPVVAAEMKELDRFAKQHHVEIIPMVQFSNQSDKPFVEETIGTIAKAFSAPHVYVTVEENQTINLWTHYKTVTALLKKHKKRSVIPANAILESGEGEQIDKDVVLLNRYDGFMVEDSARRFPKQIRFISSFTNQSTGIVPDYGSSSLGILNASRNGAMNGSIGMITFSGAAIFRDFHAYEFSWTAECSWHSSYATVSSFDEKFFSWHFGNPQAGNAARVVFTLLSQPDNQVTWSKLWSVDSILHPATRAGGLIQAQRIESSSALAREFIDLLTTVATRNKEHIGLLEFAVDLHEWVASKLRFLSVRLLSGGTNEQYEIILKRLQGLKGRFIELRLKTDGAESLQSTIERFDQEISFWQEKVNMSRVR